MSNKILRSSFIYLALGFLPMGINFLLSPLYSHILTPEQNALLSQATIFQGFLGVFLSLSIDSAFSRFYFDFYKDEKKLREYMSSVIIFIVLLSSFVLVLLHLWGDPLFLVFQKNQVFTFHKYGIWVFYSTFCVIVQSIFLSYYRNKEKIMGFAIVSLSYFLLSVCGILIGLLYFEAGAYGSLVGRAVAYSALTIIVLTFFFRYAGFHLKIKYLKDSLRYSIPVIPYLLLMTLYGNIDRILIERYFSLGELGVYNFAFVISGAVSVLLSSGQNVISPMVYKLLSEDVVEEGKVRNAFKWFHFICLSLICLGLGLAVKFTEIFIAAQYQSILEYIGTLFLAYVFRAYYLIYVDSLFFYKKTRWIFLITLGSFMIGLASNLLLIPTLGILGVCISVMIINLTQAAGAYIQLILYKLNRNFYNLGFNHFFTVMIVGGYFLAMIVFIYSGIDTKYANYIPLIVAVLFSTFFIYRNRNKFDFQNFLNNILRPK